MADGWLWDPDALDASGAKKTPPQRAASPAKKKPAIGASVETPLSVNQLNNWVKKAIDAQIPKVWVEAEISDLARPQSGHLYLTLKDADAQVRAVMWRSTASRLAFDIEDGMSVLCYGNVDVYAPRGSYQLIISKLEPKGVGALQLAFQQLHKKLEKEGLFRVEAKKPLPAFPKRIGVVTSPTGAAIRDFLEVLRRRWRDTEVIIIPTKVQGVGAADEIADAIRLAQDIRPALDILVVTRGGGSMEDLWCFNEEPVVRGIAASQIPTISAVGHEIDVTLSDLAADMRALTPSEAAERILPNESEIRGLLDGTRVGVNRLIDTQLARLQQRLDQLANRPALLSPESVLDRLNQRVDELQMRLSSAISKTNEREQLRLEGMAKQLDALSPVRVLARGFSVLRDPATKSIVRKKADVESGQLLTAVLSDGEIQTRVE
jgi:exodeoxyribonuclease VII large subunit